MALPSILSKNLKIPVVAAPLFIISNPDLVIAQCKAGVIGSFPALNARPAEELDRWLEKITTELAEYDRQNPDNPSAPFAVNQIVHSSNDRLQHDVEMCVKWKVPIVITSLGAKEFVNEAIHSYGGIVLHDIINNRFAHKAIEKGADGLIAVAAGAGGHAGSLSPFALIQEIREWFDGPIALSGSISTGQGILSALACGADYAYIGSAFIATKEANATDGYKEAITKYNSNDIVYTDLVTGVKGNYLKPSLAAAGFDPDNLPKSDPSKMDFSSSDGMDKKKAWKDIWGCGQGIGAIKDVLSCNGLVERLKFEYSEAKNRLNKIA
jgi:nitronate monooxygenase